MTTASLLTSGTARRVVLVPAPRSAARQGEERLRRFRLARLRLEGAEAERPPARPRAVRR